MKFDINAARSAGYSDDEIADYLAQENNFDLEGALKSGYSASEVVGFLSGGASAAPAPAPAPAADTGDDMARMLARNPAPKQPGLVARVANYLKPEYTSVMADYRPTPQELQAEKDRRLSYGAGPISGETAAAADLVRSGMAETKSPTVKKVAKAMKEQGTPSFGDLAQRAKDPESMRAAREAKADEFRTAGEWALDTLSNVSQGTVGLVQLPINIIAPSSEIAETLRDTQKELQAAESDVLKANRERLKERVLNEDGFLDRYVATAKELVTNPTLTIAEAAKQIPNFLGVVAAARATGALAAGGVALAGRASPTLALGEAISGGAIQTAARVAGTTAGGSGASMVMAGGDAAGSTYEKLTDRNQTPLSVWKKNEDFQKLVADGKTPDQAIEEIATTKARMAALITAPLGLLGYMGAESAIASRGLGRATAEALTAKGMAKTAVKDLIGEQLEEGGTQLGSNVFSRTVDSSQSLTEGVPEAMATALVTSAPFTAAGLRSQYTEALAPQAADIQAERMAVDRLDPQSYDRSLIGAAQTVRGAADVGPSAPARTLNFTAPDSPTSQAGLTPITVPVPSAAAGTDAALAAVGSGQALPATVGAGQQTAGLARPFNRATDQDLLSRTEAAVAAKGDNNAVAEPTQQWFGRKGDGYATEADALQAIAGRQRMFKDLDWKVELMPSGKFRLAGYEQNVQVPTEASTATAATGGLPAAGATVPAVEAAGVEAPDRAPILQNRDRSTPTSVVQMQSIAAKPDYGRLGFSRDFANGAPVVAGGQVPAQQLGKQDVAVASDGRRIPVQYAVMEAQDVLPSNRVDGTPNAEYGTAVDRVRAIAGNGRVAGLQAAFEKGTAGNYVQELSADNLHGISPQVIAGMKQPVLVRVMPTSAVTADIGDVSNTTGNLTLSPVEQAKNDGQRVALDALQFAEDGSITPEAVRQFVRAMPQAEQGVLIDTNGQPTKQAVERLNAAVFSRAYGNDQIVRLFAQAQDPEARLIMSALAQAAPRMARLEGAGALDIRGLVTDAVEIAINARRNGISLQSAAEQLDMTADPDVAVLLNLFARNNRSNKQVVEALNRAADFAYSEANKSDTDMFGEVPRASRSDVINQLDTQDEQASQATLEDAAGGFFAEQDAGRRGADGQGSAAPDQAQAGRAGQAQGVSDGTQAAEALQSRSQRQEEAADAVDRFAALEQSQGRLPESEIARLGGVRGAPQARLSAQQLLNRYSQQSGAPAPQLGTPDADAEETVNVLGNLFGAVTGIGPSAIAYKEVGGDNGFSLRGVAFINTAADTDVSAPRTTLHELKHVVEQIARADTKAGRSNTPAQQFVQSIDSIFDEMTDVGKRAYVENFLHKADLAKIADPAKREAAIQKYLASPLLRSEMTADFLGNRAQDRAFLIDLARQDPGGFEGFVQRWLAVIDNLLAKLRGSKDQGRKESAKVDQYVRDLNKAKMVARDALIAFRKGNLAEIAAAQQAEVQAQGVAASSRQADIDPKPASAADVRKAQSYERENGILPYTSAGQIEVPIGVEVGPILFSIKQEGKYGNHPLFDIPVNKNGTVTLYYPATNAEARRVAKDKTLRATPGSNRIYLTNESSGARVMGNPGNIEQTLEGANVLVQVDPGLLQLDMEHADGRKDFFIPLAEGKEFFRKMRMTRLFTQNAPRTKALTKDTKLTDLERRIDDGVKKYLSLTKAEQRVRLKEARTLLKREHNVTTLLGVNGKLEKTNTGGYGLNNYDGKDVKSMGLGLASAQKINENNLSTCPKSAICESLCLGETSGQNLLYGGDGQYKSGPRLSQYLKTEAMVVHPEEFAVVLHSEIAKLQRDAKKEDYQATVRLNVTSDFRPQTFKGIIEAFPDVMFYDYTKLPSKSIADNHHLTYSSTGASQVVNGKTIVNTESNWNKMVEVMRRGDNVAMAFSDKNTMPSYVVDERSGERFQVWNGDNYDARFLDPKPGQEGNEFGKGMIIGLTNKDRTGKPEQAAEKNRGFFIDYNPERDGDTVVIKNQDFLAANTKFVPIKVERRAAATDDVPTMSRRQAETIDVDGVERPTLNSNGQPIHSTEDGLRNFWRWFGDSKVVDEQGRPQIVYHVSRNGSPNVFKTEGNMASGFKLDASFFASDRLYAKEYAKVIGASQYDIGEFYLSSTNPLSRQMSPREFSDPPVEAKIIKEAREAGNDAVQFLGDQEYGEAFWAVFNPNQIKSATDNSGTFDPENPDIRFSARQASADQDPELITIFEGLQSGRGLKGVRAREAAAAHPLGDAIQKVHNDFYDILERLDNAGLIEINC